jgi:outer membrane protein
MKNTIKAAVLVLIMSVAMNANAQKTGKIGHIDFGKLIEMMPGQDTVKTALELYSKQLNDEYTTMQTELETKYNEYIKGKDTYPPIIKSAKEKELNDLQTRMQDFSGSAQTEMSDYETKLTTPFITKAKAAINEVAKENGFAYIYNNVEGFLLYTEGGEDIMPLVKKKLNIQ